MTVLYHLFSEIFLIINLKNKVNVLDIGCGGGNNLFFVAEMGLNAYGIDGSENAIKIANRRFKDKKLSAQLLLVIL